jgi:hypothetical protein
MTADVTVLPVDAETAERVAQLRNVCRGDPQIGVAVAADEERGRSVGSRADTTRSTELAAAATDGL